MRTTSHMISGSWILWSRDHEYLFWWWKCLENYVLGYRIRGIRIRNGLRLTIQFWKVMELFFTKWCLDCVISGFELNFNHYYSGICFQMNLCQKFNCYTNLVDIHVVSNTFSWCDWGNDSSCTRVFHLFLCNYHSKGQNFWKSKQNSQL